MRGFPTREQVNRIKERYPIGTVIELTADMEDNYNPIPKGMQCKDIETALSVYEKMDKFTLDRSCTTATHYVDKVLENLDLPMKEQFSFYLSKDGYGKALMQYNGVDVTSYGMLIPDEGIRLSELLQKDLSEQLQNQNTEMTISM